MKLKGPEAIGMLIGAVIGAIPSGIVFFQTRSNYAVLICPALMFLGGYIGSKIQERKEK